MTGIKAIRQIKKNPGPLWEVSAVVAGILLFAVFIHHSFPVRILSFVGLTGSALMLGYSVRNVSILQAFGLIPLKRRIFFFMIPALFLGLGLAWLTRRTFDLSPFPSSISHFVLIAPLIGAAEELIFRGYIQGHLRPIGRIFAVVYSSAVHTCYKLVVILSLSLTLQFDFFFLGTWTFLGGLLLGVLREGAKNTIPAIISHAIFDILLYGGYSMSPAWVWS